VTAPTPASAWSPLRRPLFRPTACYGHFGRTDIDAPWEDTARAADLRAELGARL